MEKHTTMVYIKRLLLKIWQSSQENTCAGVSFFLKLQATTWNFIKKEILTQVIPMQLCKKFKNTFKNTSGWMIPDMGR